MSYRRSLGYLLAGLMILLVPSTVTGEGPEVFGLKTSGDVVVGGRVYADRPPPRDRAEFEEYRDLPESAFLQYLRLRGDSKDDFYTVEFFAINGGQQDQKFQVRSYGVGKFDFLFEWDQIPHLLCTTCRTLFVQGTQGTFTLPTPRPSPLTAYNAAPAIDEVGFRTDTALVDVAYTPTSDWDIGVEFRLSNKHGDRPVGLPFGTPGNQAAEVPAPIQETAYGVHVNAGYAGDGYQLQFGYDLSIFNNDINALIVDNPCFGLPAALPAGCGGSSGGPLAPATGQGALAPDNMANTFTLAGGVNLPMKSRLNASFSYSWRTQDQSFLPFTVNPTLAANPIIVAAQNALPDNLNGDVQILRFNLGATSRPMERMTATANFRLYSYNDNSDAIPFTAYVEDDRSIQSGASLNERAQLAQRYPYTKYNAGADVRYQLFDPLAVKVGFYWERWDRKADLLAVDPTLVEPGGDSVLNVPREVGTTDEYTPKLMLDYTPLDWLLFRLSYAYSIRNASTYLQASEEQFGLLRKYDMADRNRNRVDFLADVFAMDNLTFTATFNWQDDDYRNTQYGLQDAQTWAAGGDVTWRPLEWLTAFVGYVHEEWDTNSHFRYRQAPNDLNNPTLDWLSKTDDRYDTVRVGFDAELIPKKLDGGATWSYSVGRTDMSASNPVPPAGSTGAITASATAQDYPDIKSELSVLNIFLRYWITEQFSAMVRYSFENYTQSDFRYDGLQPFNASTGDTIFLGLDPQNYTAHYFTLSLGYHF